MAPIIAGGCDQIVRGPAGPARGAARGSRGTVAARLELGDPAGGEEALEVLAHRPALDAVDVRRLDLGTVDEPMRHDVVERVRLGEVGQELVVALRAITSVNLRSSRKASRPSTTCLWWNVTETSLASSTRHTSSGGLEVLQARDQASP